MRTTFWGKIKGVKIAVPRPTEDEPNPDPVSVVTIETELEADVLKKLYQMMQTSVSVQVGTDQLGFDVGKDGNGRAAFVPETAKDAASAGV